MVCRRAEGEGYAQAPSRCRPAAAILPAPARAQAPMFVRRSIGDLIREESPTIESFRRGVAAMMQRDITDKTSWWFWANIHGVPEAEAAQLRSLAKYWEQCPH